LEQISATAVAGSSKMEMEGEGARVLDTDSVEMEKSDSHVKQSGENSTSSQGNKVKDGSGSESSSSDTDCEVEFKFKFRAPRKSTVETTERKIKLMKHDFQRIIKDITIQGVYPVFSVIISFFNDYMRSRFGHYTQQGLRKILYVISASLTCSIQPSEYHVSMSS
jgi:hypothetical protein